MNPLIKKTILTLVFVTSVCRLLAQTIGITGKVVDAVTLKPITHASVFLSNAAQATATNNEGFFTLTNVKPGKYELIVSHIGFKLYTQSVLVEKGTLDVAIKLTVEAVSLKEVIIKSRKNSASEIKMFADALLGTSVNADQCKIENPDVINLSYSGKNGVLEASTSDFLMIKNNALGYRLQLLLNSFKKDYDTKFTTYTAKIFFEELKGSSSQLKKWKKNRADTYLGSMRHFYRSLYQNQLKVNGFEAYQVITLVNQSREPEDVIKKHLAQLYNQGRKANTDTLHFWTEQYRLPQYHFEITDKVTPEDSIYRKTDTVGVCRLIFDQHLYVLSKLKKSTYQNFTKTILTLNGDAKFDRNGVLFNTNDVIYEGTGIEKIADILPNDFLPDQQGNL